MRSHLFSTLFISAISVSLPAATAPGDQMNENPIPSNQLTPAAAERFVNLALDCVHREYPNKIAHVMANDEDAQPPRKLTPVFYGCFDWHSAVHGHWLLVRLSRLHPEAPFRDRALTALALSFTEENVKGEVEYLGTEGRYSFERPYGLAWLLQLCAELREWNEPLANQWSNTLHPLEAIAAKRIKDWLPKLSHPIRVGTHGQSAFALGIIHDWAKTAGDDEIISLIHDRARTHFLDDRNATLRFEPSGHDFLSPILAEADLMRRILPPTEFAAWLGSFLPELSASANKNWLTPAVVTDKTDGHLVHLDGLNLSRAWMLQGIAHGLPKNDPRIKVLKIAAENHRHAGLDAIENQHYEGGHWLGSFAVYLTTNRGIN
jgi:hypothetical protein